MAEDVTDLRAYRKARKDEEEVAHIQELVAQGAMNPHQVTLGLIGKAVACALMADGPGSAIVRGALDLQTAVLRRAVEQDASPPTRDEFRMYGEDALRRALERFNQEVNDGD